MLTPKLQNLNQQNVAGETALHAAVGDLKVFKYLMSCGAKIDPNITNHRHQSPLHYACLDIYQLSLENRIEIVKTLVPLTKDTNKKDMFDKSPLDYAREYGFTEIVKILSEKLMD